MCESYFFILVKFANLVLFLGDTSQRPVIISPKDKYTTVNAKEDVNFTCRGSEPLKWTNYMGPV